MKDLIHELRITNQRMFLHPPVEGAREQLLHELFAWEAVITQLPRLEHSRYQVFQLSEVHTEP
jgi:dynein heavy chain 1